MGREADRFHQQLRALYEAARSPTLSRLVALGTEQRPPLTISDTTLSAWLTGEAVPGRSSTPYFMVLVAFLRARAKSGPSTGDWTLLLDRARTERDARRGGKARGSERASEQGPVTLPAESAVFSGRDEAVTRLLTWLAPEWDASEGTSGKGAPGKDAPGKGPDPAQPAVVVSAMTGMGGVGKTALALHAAHHAARNGWFPGGVLFADLRGYSHESPVDAATVADQLLRALGFKGKDLPTTPAEKIDAWRLVLAQLAEQGRPLLAVLDNVRTAGQASPLLPAAGPHRVLVTSRQTLAALGARRIELAPLAPPEAVALLDQVLRLGGDGRPDGEADDRATAQPVDAARIAELCGRLPLALRIMGALLADDRDRPLRDQAEELAAARLDVLALEDTDDQGRPLEVRTVFYLSYRHLPPSQARAFRLLSAAPGPDVGTPAAAVLLGDPVGARRLLRDLARAHLLEHPAAERWSMHDLVRLYAAELGAEHAHSDRRREALSGLLDHYMAETRAATSHLEGSSPDSRFAGREQAMGWLEAERPNLVAAVTDCAAGHVQAVVALGEDLRVFLLRYRRVEDLIAIARATLEGLRRLAAGTAGVSAPDDLMDGFRVLEAGALNNLGNSLREARRYPEAMAAHAEALGVAQRLGDRTLEADCLNGAALVLLRVRRFGDAVAPLRVAAAIHREAGDLRREGRSLANLGTALMRLDRDEEAYEVLGRDLAICRETGDRYGEAETLSNLGLCLRHLGRLDDAVDAHRQACLVFAEMGDPYSEGQSLDNLALCLRRLNRPQEALADHVRAAALFRSVGDRHAEAMAVGNSAGALQEAGRPAEAIPLHVEAAATFEETGDSHAQGAELTNLGRAYEAEGRVLEAAESQLRAIALFRAVGDNGAADAALRLLARLPLPPAPEEDAGTPAEPV
ncbi:tetratricopeptide repeat protein [Streptomyces sp. NRRL F-5126]|uniref:tetratricopeptide repeat protein n=1 Tax=Streptomyces sp. NRRL F-5126 TaxID=1463857 RepID=UPI00068A7419|nr:tetratricopeptide repeat protein [Streptomyces sp. NRRL F-5126]